MTSASAVALLLAAAAVIVTSPCLVSAQLMENTAGGPAAVPAAVPVPLPAAAPAGDATGASWNSSVLTFCVSNWEPIAMCTNGTQYTPANFTGHDVEMVRGAADNMGLVEGVDYRFKCCQFSGMMADLLNPEGECSAAAAGITITSEREASGIKFTYPYYKSSLGVLVQATQHSGTGWGFTRPFSWNLWVALLLTLILLPPLIFGIEFFSLRKRIHRDDVAPGIGESSWRGAITLMLFDHFAVSSLGARVAVLTFCFLALLVTSTYTANLAAFVTVSTIASRINSIQDLRGRAVGTSPVYLERLRSKYGIQATPYSLNNGSDYLTWRDMVASGELAALVRDEPALLWLANTAPGCNVMMLPQTIEPFDYGIAFHTNSSDERVETWSRQLLILQEDGTLSRLKTGWISSTEAGCQAIAQVNKEATAVSFADLYGLWIILGAGLVLGTAIMVAQRTLRRYKKYGTTGGVSGKADSYDGGGGGTSGEHRTLADGRRPVRLMSALGMYVGRSSRGRRGARGGGGGGAGSERSERSGRSGWWRVSGGGGGGPQDGKAVAANGQRTVVAAETAASGQPPNGSCWDVESCGEGASSAADSSSLSPQPSLATSVTHTQPAATPQPAAAPSAAPQAASASAAASAAASPSPSPSPSPAGGQGRPAQRQLSAAAAAADDDNKEEAGLSRRSSALQSVESVYAAYKWKSAMRTSQRGGKPSS